MSTTDASATLELPEDIAVLKAHIEHLGGELAAREAALAQRDEAIASLHEQIRLLLARRFGASSERVADGQLGLFNEAEELVEQDSAEDSEAIEVEGHKRRRRGKRAPLPEHLPRIDVMHELSEAERVCPNDGARLEAFAEETSEQLDVEPARFRVLRHRRVKYRCPCCTEHLRTVPITPQPIPKSEASPGLLAFIATSKYVDGLPLYRLAKQFERIGVEIPRQTQARWMVHSGDLVRPLINLLRERMLEGRYIHCDETTVQVLNELGKGAQSKSYMWVQASGTGEQPVVLFDYDPSRSAQIPKRLLTALSDIRNIYAIERRIRDRPPDERHEVRQCETRKVCDRLHQWATKTRPRVAPKTPLGKALAYLLEHWEGLIRFLDDGRLEVDNNRAENAIRPFTLGRRGWLFSATVEGAKASANLYSLVESAKANGIEPYAYLRHVFTELPKAKTIDDVEALLPWQVDRKSLKL
jgi:transposase